MSDGASPLKRPCERMAPIDVCDLYYTVFYMFIDDFVGFDVCAAVHPLFALVASTADRAKAVAESSTNAVANASSRETALFDSDAALEVDVESLYRSGDIVHTDQLQRKSPLLSIRTSS